MLHLICTIIKNVNSYRRETLWQVHDFIIVSLIKSLTRITTCQMYWLKLTILSQRTFGLKCIANLMLKPSLFIMFCKTDADFHQIALLHFILVPAPKCTVTLVLLGCKGNDWSSCFHTLIVMILCFLNNIMQDLRK